MWKEMFPSVKWSKPHTLAAWKRKIIAFQYCLWGKEPGRRHFCQPQHASALQAAGTSSPVPSEGLPHNASSPCSSNISPYCHNLQTKHRRKATQLLILASQEPHAPLPTLLSPQTDVFPSTSHCTATPPCASAGRVSPEGGGRSVSSHYSHILSQLSPHPKYPQHLHSPCLLPQLFLQLALVAEFSQASLQPKSNSRRPGASESDTKY